MAQTAGRLHHWPTREQSLFHRLAPAALLAARPPSKHAPRAGRSQSSPLTVPSPSPSPSPAATASRVHPEDNHASTCIGAFSRSRVGHAPCLGDAYYVFRINHHHQTMHSCNWLASCMPFQPSDHQLDIKHCETRPHGTTFLLSSNRCEAYHVFV